jgi:hypothetical protein
MIPVRAIEAGYASAALTCGRWPPSDKKVRHDIAVLLPSRPFGGCGRHARGRVRLLARQQAPQGGSCGLQGDDDWRQRLSVARQPRNPVLHAAGADRFDYVLEMFPYPVGAHPHGPCAQLHAWATWSRATSARGLQRAASRWAGTRSACRPKMPRWKRRSIPAKWTYENIATMKAQLKRLGLSLDWSRELATCEPDYYGQEQALFLDLLRRRASSIARKARSTGIRST